MKIGLTIIAGILFLISEFAFSEEAYENNGRLSGSIKSTNRTQIDFNETLIEGKMKAPSGFFIQGRQAQSMAQMVKLRSNFRNKLIQSKYGVKAIVK